MKHFFTVSLVSYEIARALFLLLPSSASDAKLSVSWYCSQPLLSLPILLVLLRHFDAENAGVYSKVYALAKMMGVVGIAFYLTRVEYTALVNETALLNNSEELKQTLYILFFLLIDSIVLVLALFTHENKSVSKNQNEQQDTTNVTCD
jgi:hypothetical protein